MEKDNALLIIEESDGKRAQKEDSTAKLKLALASKKLKDDFFKDNEINKTAEIFNDDFENEIDESISQMEQTVGLTYDSDDEAATSNGNHSKRRANSTSSSGSCDTDDEAAMSAKNSQLIESSVLQRKMYDEYQQASSVMLPFYERRRLSECKEESESDSDEELEAAPSTPTIVITPTNGAAPKKRFTVTKTVVAKAIVESPVKQPVSILKKTPSPPSNQKILLKKIRYEASALKNVSPHKNAQTIHFPCTSAAIERANVKSFFSPQGFLNPHLDPRFFDTSLVEVRASQTLNDSSKSLDDKGTRQLDDNVWIKRRDKAAVDDKISISSDSIDRNNRGVGDSVS